MRIEDLKRYLRQNKPRKDGRPGTFTLRLMFNVSKELKPLRIEIGLGTPNEQEALERAAIFLKGVYALGGSFSSRVALGGRKHCIPLADAIPTKERTRKRPCEDLPLFRFGMQILPPQKRVENKGKS